MINNFKTSDSRMRLTLLRMRNKLARGVLFSTFYDCPALTAIAYENYRRFSIDHNIPVESLIDVMKRYAPF